MEGTGINKVGKEERGISYLSISPNTRSTLPINTTKSAKYIQKTRHTIQYNRDTPVDLILILQHQLRL
jgi:hypothetical protein